MPTLVNYRGGDDLRPIGFKDSGRFFSVTPDPDAYTPPCKRLRIQDSFFLLFEEEKNPSIEILPDECLYEIFRRLPETQARSAAACVSTRWLTVLSNVRNSEIVSSKVKVDDDVEIIQERCLEGKKATDIRLAAIAVSTSAHGGLGKLSVRGTDQVTRLGFSAIARACLSLKVLSLWNVSIGDEALVEISKECHSLEKLDLCQCPSISSKGISIIASNCPNLSSLTIESCGNIGNESLQALAKCCPRLQSISIKDCPRVGDQGVAALLSLTSSVLKHVKLQALNITDLSLAMIGHYGKSVTNLALTGLQSVSQKGFWAMGNAKGLESLTSLTVTSCYGVTDLSLEAIGNGCQGLKHVSIKKCCFISDKGLVSFVKSSGFLESLRLEECNRISERGIFGALSSCKSKLKSFALVNCIGIKDLAEDIDFPQCESLRSLTIKNCIGFGNGNLAVIGKLCPELCNLDLSGLRGVTDAGLFGLLGSLKAGLVKVNLSECLNLTDVIVVDLARIHGGTLEVLNLKGCWNVTDKSLVVIAENCTLLSDLDISRCCITDTGVSRLSRGALMSLQVLSLSGCPKVSDKSLSCLKKLGKTLLGLNLQHCCSVSSSTIESLVKKLWMCDILS